MIRSFIILALCSLALLAAGCRDKGSSNPATGSPGVPPPPPGVHGQTTKGVNLLAPMKLDLYPPLNLDFSRDGSVMLGVMTNAKGGAPLVYRFDVTAEGLAEPTIWYQSVNMIQATLSSNAEATECLIQSYVKHDNKTIWDLVFRLQGGDLYPVDYASAPGLPTVGRPDTWYGLHPFYSWSGGQIIVPLRSMGLAVTDATGQQAKYVEYPKLPFNANERLFGALPDTNGKQRIWASFFSPGLRDDKCQLYTLDLGTLKWSLIYESNWIIYHVAGSDFDNEPWLVAGSRAPADAVEGRRFARFGRVDPASKSEDLLEFYGTADFEVALEPHGKYIAYTDPERKAIVRLEPATGKLDIDPRWYDVDAKLFICEGGDPVYVWKAGQLVRADFTKHEQFKGYDQ